MKTHHKIILGDCLECLELVDSGEVDLIVTDPPFFLPVQTYVGKRGEGYVRRTLGDASVLKGYFGRVIKRLNRVLSDTGTYYIFCDGQSYPIFYEALFPYCKYVRPLIWDKLISYNGYTWRHQHELIAWGELDGAERVPTGDGDILKCRAVLQKDRLHPVQKPLELVKRLITKHGKEGDTVLDIYAGSFTTAKACIETGRNSISMEINPDYWENIGRKRLNADIPTLDNSVTFEVIEIENDQPQNPPQKNP